MDLNQEENLKLEKDLNIQILGKSINVSVLTFVEGIWQVKKHIQKNVVFNLWFIKFLSDK